MKAATAACGARTTRRSALHGERVADGAGDGNRTHDLSFTKAVLYR